VVILDRLLQQSHLLTAARGLLQQTKTASTETQPAT
jgi:hypothetical protein